MILICHSYLWSPGKGPPTPQTWLQELKHPPRQLHTGIISGAHILKARKSYDFPSLISFVELYHLDPVAILLLGVLT